MKLLKKADIAHILRAAAAVTNCKQFVLVGTGAVIVVQKTPQAFLMHTREIDIYTLDASDPGEMSDLIDGSLGEGSQFNRTFGYFADGVSKLAACLPADWETRATTLPVPGAADVSVVCPSPSDIALSKLCAWREKDIAWLREALLHGIANIEAMRQRHATIDNPHAPPADEILLRIGVDAPSPRSQR